jgi:hypothetical protein
MTGPKIVMHHDLFLYRDREKPVWIGPKYLYDQFPEAHRVGHVQQSTFALSLDMPGDQLAALASDALYMPWTLGGSMDKAIADQITEQLFSTYGQPLADAFKTCLSRFA